MKGVPEPFDINWVAKNFTDEVESEATIRTNKSPVKYFADGPYKKEAEKADGEKKDELR